ncbi:MAG: MFS transporter, partial [Acidimicrobiia bacterium]|nr:MFS transporter [Acidimicrobiia bacterium]
LAATAGDANTTVLLVSMFLLGLAWNFGFVSGSTLLQLGHSVADRLKLQGVADSTAWVSSAAAAVMSGILLATTSYPALAVIGGFLATIPVLALIRTRLTSST